MAQIKGRAFILGAKYPRVVKRSKAKFKALLCDIVGDITRLTEALARDKVTDHIQWYGKWKDLHNFSNADTADIKRNAAKLQKLAVKYHNKKFYYAPYLEDRLSAEFKIKIFQELRDIAPSVELVNCPIKGGAILKDYINEIHADGGIPKPKGRYFYSVDGRASELKGFKNGSVDMPHDLRLKHADAEVLMEWVLQDNGKRNTKDKRKREDRGAWLTETMDRSVCFHFTERGPVVLAKKYLYGSHAEQSSDEGGGTQNKPFFISPVAEPFNQISITDLQGKVIAKSLPRLKYKHGGWLYRFTDWGFRYAEKAIKAQGSPTCFIVADGKRLGKINPGFRQPGR
jgi:hypothetical protein